jgi:hypothetical protein
MTVPIQAQKDQSPIVTLAMPPNSIELLLDEVDKVVKKGAE